MQVLYCRIWEDRDIQKTSASEHLRDAEPLLSDWAMRPQSRLLHSSARHTSFRTRPCSSLLPKQHLPSLQCSSGCGCYLISLHKTDSFALETFFTHGFVLLMLLLTTWCHYWGASVLIGAPPPNSVSFWFDFPEMRQLADQFCGSGAQGSFQMGESEAPPAGSQP